MARTSSNFLSSSMYSFVKTGLISFHCAVVCEVGATGRVNFLLPLFRLDSFLDRTGAMRRLMSTADCLQWKCGAGAMPTHIYVQRSLSLAVVLSLTKPTAMIVGELRVHISSCAAVLLTSPLCRATGSPKVPEDIYRTKFVVVQTRKDARSIC